MTYDLTRLINNVVDNTLFSEQRDRAILNYERIANKNLPNIFKRFAVLDVITDRRSINLEEIRKKFGDIDNAAHAANIVVPRNTIIAKPLYASDMGNNDEAMRPMFLYPFFPSHLSFPCKPGEHVWAMFESLTEIKSLGYWLCRIVGPDHIDDVNFSPATREYDETFSKDSSTRQQPGQNSTISKPRYHFKNGVYRQAGPGDDGSPMGQIIDTTTSYILPSVLGSSTNISDLYEDILTQSAGSKEILLEPIPRYKKKPGDVVLEGSNNSLIILGIEDSALSNENYNNSIGAGNIDLVAGRGSTPETLGKIVDNDLNRKEIDKFYDSLQPDEGKPDYANDRSRILISQRTKTNEGFGLRGYNEGPFVPSSPSRPRMVDSEQGDAAVIIKSDKVKIIARSDIQFIVQGFTTKEDPLGRNIMKQGNEDINSWASITIKSNGDIVFTPSTQGFIKLGGDDADRPLICAAQPALTDGGIVKGTAVQNTAGGQMGGSIGVDANGKSLSAVITNEGVPSTQHGTFASKVLVK